VVEKILELFGSVIDVNARDINGCSALHYLCAYGKLSLVKLLLRHNADVSLEDNQRRTPLDYTAMTQSEVEKILLSINISPERDANVTMSDLRSYLYNVYENYEADFSVLDDVFGPLSHYNYSVLATLSNFEKLKPCSSDEAEIKRFNEQQETIRKYFAGESVIQRCMFQKELVAKFLISFNVQKSKETPISFAELEVVANTNEATPSMIPFYEIQQSRKVLSSAPINEAPINTTPNHIPSFIFIGEGRIDQYLSIKVHREALRNFSLAFIIKRSNSASSTQNGYSYLITPAVNGAPNVHSFSYYSDNNILSSIEIPLEDCEKIVQQYKIFSGDKRFRL